MLNYLALNRLHSQLNNLCLQFELIFQVDLFSGKTVEKTYANDRAKTYNNFTPAYFQKLKCVCQTQKVCLSKVFLRTCFFLNESPNLVDILSHSF